MLLTNWLRSISKRCRSPRTRKTAQQRRMRSLSAASLSHALSTRESIAQTEVLEDRTLLTIFFKVTSENFIDEGDSGTSTYIFTVTRFHDYQSNLNSVAWVDFNTIDGTALAGSDDYIPVSTRLTFEASSTAYDQKQTVEVQIKGDSLVEKDEYFAGVLSNSSAGTTIDRGYSSATIRNDDQAVVSINDVTVNESAGSAELTISVAGTFESSFDVIYSTSNGTATSNKDYTQTGGIFSFEPGDVSKTVTVDLIDDDLFELDEQFDVNLFGLSANGYNIVLGDTLGTVTIQPDADFVPQYEMHSKFFVPDSPADTDPESDSFGRALAVDGDTLIVSSPAWDGAGNNLGAVFIYIRNDQGTLTDYTDDTWDYQTTLLPPAGSLTSGFGYAVAISGNTAVIANQNDAAGANGSGAIYVYTRTNNIWTFRQKIKASDYEAGDNFGASVAIDNDTIVVGTPNSRGEKIFNATGSDLNQGAVYVYTRSGNSWLEKAKLTASDLQQGRQLGNAVDIQGTTILAGAVTDHELAYASGAAYLFELQNDEWIEIQKLKASVIQQDANFGYSVSLDGDSLVIGTPNHTFPNPTNGNPQKAGAAFVFSRENQVWHQTQMLTFSQVVFNTGFGRAVEIKGDRILVGSIYKYVNPSSNLNGPVYLFRKVNSSWVLNDDLMDDSLPDGARFGERIALADHSVLVGAYADPEQADWAGSVYIFNETDRPLITVGDVTITEGDTGSKYATIVVTRTGTSPGDLSIPALVNFTTRDAEAMTATGDYAAASETLVFDGDPNAVSQTRTFTVQIFGDTFVEKNETFLIELSDIIGDARVLEKTSTVTIREDDQSLVRIDDVSVHENEGTATIFVSLDKPVDATVSVDYTTANRTAYSTADYVSTSGTITFIAGTQSQAITIPIVNNSQVEAEESFYVNLSHIQSEGANVAFSDSQGEVSIQDDDQTVIPLLSIDDLAVNEDAGTATLNVSLSSAIPTTVTVDYITANNTAVSPSDYLARSGTVSFNPLETAKTITIPIFDSGTVEDDETFFVFLDNIQSGVYQVLMNDDQALVTILEKTRPRLTISDLSVNEGAGTATLSVKLSRALTEAVSIEYATADDSAHSTTDFESSTGIVTFAVGETTQTIEIPLTDDNLVEADESFLVNLFNLQDGSLDVGVLDNQARVTIRDNNQATISIDDITVNEDAGTAVLQVSLSAPVDGDVFVDFATADQTAISPDAYVETTGTLQFHAGEQMKTITIPIVNTTPLEAYQSFLVNLSHVQSNGMIVTIADNQAKVTIIDSIPLRLSIDNVTVDEAGGTATLYVSLNQAIDSPFSVDFHTDSHTALPTSDYTDTSGTIFFTSQQTTKVITIPLVNDDVIEPDEIFLVSLENIQSADYLIEFGDDQAFVKIEDDDTPPLKISDDSDFVLQQRLSADPANANHSQDYFGRIVAIDGDTMVVGVPEILLSSTSIYLDSGPGAVYVYTRNQNGTATDKTDDTWDFQTALTPDPFQENHFSFGSSIAVYDDTIVVGAKHESSGTVYIFTRSGNNWTSQPPQVATVTIPDLYSNAQVGGAVAIYEDTIVVGAVNGSNGGIAYILEKQGETWAAPKISEIKPSDLHSLDYFGNAVAIHGDLIVVGAKYAGPNGYWSGAAYVVTKNGADWSTLSPTIAKLLPRNGTMFGEFGSKVATNGVDVAISSAKKDSNSYAIGSVQIFTRNGTDWSTLDPTEVKFYSGIQYDEFGSDLALTADRLIVGATGDSKTYIYHKTTSSWYSATLDQVISHGVGSNTEFGFGVATSGSTIVIGAPGDDSVSSNSGSIITYEKTGSNNWTQSDELLPGENQPSHNGGDLFGNHIAIDGDYMVVSAAGTDSSLVPEGMVYLYSRNDQGTPSDDTDDTWDFVRGLLPPDLSAVTGFGTRVAIDGGTILIGARLTSGKDEVYIYERNGADWTLLPPKVSPLLSKYTYKNSDVSNIAVSGDTIVIGQPKATGNFSTSGVISVYAKRGSDWSTLSPVETVLYADDGSYGDKFGQSIDIDGDRIIVGAPEKGDTGAVYLFEKGSTSWRTTATQHRLTINEPLIYELLGKAVSIEGDLVAVAAKYDDVSTPNGVVYLLDSSTGWDQPVQTTFSASETNLTLYYGDHIDLSGQTLVVSNGSTESRAGLYIYDGSSGWDSLNGTKLSLNPDAREYRSFFASEFAVSGNNIVSYASTGSPRAIGEVYVINRRPLPEISIEDASIVEGDAGTQSLQLTVTLTGNNLDLIPGNNVSFAYATANGTATTAGNDYQSQTGTLTFDTSSGASSYTKTILINITGDTNPESDEYFYVSLSAPSVPVLIRKHQAKVTIENDDQINLSIDDLTVHSDAQTANVTVSLNQEIDVPVSIEFTTVDQTAINAVDYQTTTGTLTFSPGETSKTISIPVFNSSQIEASKTFLVNLSNLQTTSSVVVLTDSQSVVTIVDADQPTFSINDKTVNEDAGTATITVTLNQALTSAVTVDYATADDSSSSGSDYQSKTGTLTFNPGDTTQTIQISIIDSDITESDETFLINLTNPQSGAFQPTLADSQAVVTIQDNDPGLLSINDITVDEDAGTALLTVSLDHAASRAISVDYATADDSASSGSDYQSKSGTLTFNPGDTTQTIEITLVDSDLIEADETFLVNLSNLQTAGLDVSLPDTQGVVTIQDDDQASLSIQDLTVDEDAGTVLLTVSLDQPLLTSIMVDFETLDGTALVDSDYTTTSGTLTFAAGETTQTITLTILDDALQESAESFFIKLSSLQQNGSPVDLANDQSEITIRDNDQAKLTISDIEVNEDIGTASLTVSLDKALTTAFTVDYQTGDDTAVVDSDYLLSSGTLTFDPGEVTKTIQVSIVDSDNVELTETLQVQLTNLQAADHLVSLSDSIGEISILDDDQATLSIDDITVNEDDGTAQLTVSLDQVVDSLVQVDFVTADQTAVAVTDYLQTSGTLTFNSGETTKTITVNLVDNDQLEADETFLVNLLNLQSEGLAISLADSQAKVTIHDDDQATLSIDDLTVDEDAGTVNLTVSLDHPVPGAITVDFETLNGTALSTADYTATSGTLTFDPGQTTQTITLEILNDDLNEAAESFFVNLTNLQANGYQVNLVDAQSEITIISDEYASLSINDVTVSEDSGMATLTVSLDQPLDSSVSVNFATANSTANSVYHYESTSGTITFNPGEQSQTISIPIIDSDWVERDRFFYVNLSEIQGTGSRVDFADSQGRVTILEDDQAVFSVDDVIVDEDVGYATVTISLSAAVKTDINLYFNTTDQTAIESQDYVNRSGVMLVPFNERIHTYRIPIIDTDQVENDETFFFNLTGISANGLNVVLGDAQGQVTIRDDDQANLTVHDLSVNEAAGKALVTVTLDKSVDGQVSVDYSTIDQSATASSDYLAKSGTLTFTPGTMQQTIEIDLVDGAPVELPETFDIQLSNLQAGGLNVVFSDNRATITIKDDDLGDYEFKNKLHAAGTLHSIDRFGTDIAVDGDTLISSTPGWYVAHPGDGGAFIYVRNDQGTPDYAGDDSWDYQATLLPPDADGVSDYFGWSVDVSGDTAVVGAFFGDGSADNMGAVYVYTRSNGIWTFQQKLTVDDSIDNGHFGDTVAIEGDTIVASNTGENDYTGSTYVFTRENGIWTEAAKLTADVPEVSARFGESIVIENSIIVIGARYASAPYPKSGAVYIFTEQDGAWTQTQKLTDPVPTSSGLFGNSISLEGNLLVIGAASSVGEAILFQRDPSSGTWNPIQTLNASDAAPNTYFGAETEIHNQQIFISSAFDPTGPDLSGAVYRFEQVNQTWVEQQKFSSVGTESGDDFGRGLAATDGAILISALLDDDVEFNTGSIYVYGLPQNPIITIEDVSITEADDGSRLITANVTRTATKPGELIYGATVDFRTIDGTATIADGDYESTTGTITFESDPDASTQTQTISIRIYGDSLLETDETFGIELLNVTGHAQIPDPEATVTIQNDDQALLSIDDITVVEDAGLAILTVTLDQPVDTTISVNYATADQSATASEDYTGTSGTLTFNPGDQTQTISVPILLSRDLESEETFLVNLSNLQSQGLNVNLADAQAVVTIIDLHSQSEFSIHAGKAVEGDNGVSYLRFEIRRTASFVGDLDFETTVDFSTFDGTAIAGEDYVSKNQTLTFSASPTATSQVQYVDVQITGDLVKEASETIIGRLNNPTGGSVFPDDADSTQTSGVIANDDTDYLFQEFLYADPVYANHTDDNTGRVLAIDGDVMVMGVPDNSANGRSVGTAYVYVRNQQGTPADQSDDTWEFETELTPATPFDANQFGSSVAINGDTIAVGAAREGGGAIYVFTRNGADWKTEPPSVEKLTVEGLFSSAYLGCAVSIYEDTIVAGARFDLAAAYYSGAAYIFEKTGADWSNPAVRTLTASDYNTYDNYGISVSIMGDLIVVGAASANIDGSKNGAAYVYTKNGDDWTSNAPSEAKIVASNGVAGDYFGKSVATNGTDIAIGAENSDPHGENSGSAYLYIRNGSDWSTVSPTELEFTGKDTSDRFGTSVSLTADRLVVGAFGADTTRSNTGAVYVYSKTGANWDLDNAAEKVLAISTDEIARLGEAVAISGTTVVAGAPDIDLDGINSGGVFVFEETAPQTWIEASELTPDISETAHNGGDRFGKVIASDENYLVIAAPGTDTAADPPSGVVYVYARDDAGTPDDENDDIWVYQTTFVAPDPADTKTFGTSVDVQGDTILVSVLMNSGSSEVYIYEMNGSDWTTIAPTRTALFDSVSRYVSQSVAVAIDGDTIVAGAHYTAGNQPYSGSAFVYTRNGSDWSTMAPSESVLFSSDGVNDDFFGYAVDISGDQIIVGAFRDDNLGGSAYLYRKGATGWDTATETKLTAQDTQTNDYFGKVVAIEGDLVAVASPQFDTTGTNNGAVYLYDGSQGWENPDAIRLTPQDDSNVSYYGSSLDLHDGTLVVGNAGGSPKTVYIYDQLSGEHIYEETALSFPSDSDLSGFGFGAAVALQGNNLVVTDLYNEASASSRIYSFNRQTPVFSIENTSIVENDNGTQALQVTVTATGLIPGIYASPSVDFSTHDGSATALDNDFQASTGTLYFDTNAPSATQTQTITIQINGDDKVEADEIFSVELSNPSMPAVLAQSTSEISLQDNDTAGLSIDDLTVDENAGTASITVSLDHPVDTIVSIDYATADQSALAGSDYISSTGTLTFNPGETTQTISIPISYSNLIELDKTFLVNLSGLQTNGRNVVLGDNQAVVTIHDDDQAAISINDISVSEDVGTATVTVSLDLPVTETISVDYALNDLTALSSSDYTDSSGTLTFLPGEQSKTINISITDSDLLENNEIFQVQLSHLQANGLNVLLKDDLGEVTIVDEASGSAEIQLRVVDTPTITELNGEADTLPTHLNYVSEWETYWVEFWIDTSVPANQGVFSAGLDFHYETSFTSATEIEFGTGFNSNQTGTIDDQAGTVSGIYAETSTDHLGESRFLLFARLKFEPLATDQVAIDLDGKSIGPYQLGFAINSQQVSLSGDVPVYTSVPAFSQTDIWANPFDFNDDDKINYRDLILLAGVYNNIPSESDLQNAWIADLNQDDKVNYRDLILLVGNYGKNKADNRTIIYPTNYPDVWNQHLLVNTLTEAQPDPQTVTQAAAENTLTSIVDQIQPQLDPAQQNSLAQVNIQVVDLQGDALGHVISNTIYIDTNAAGYGWFIDTTPFDHSEFVYSSELTLIALEDGPAANQIDLWTVIMHELGHILGADHAVEGVMQKTLDPGIRKLPGFLETLNEAPLQSEKEIDDFFSDMTEDIDLIVL